jgi:hypothetical protein
VSGIAPLPTSPASGREERLPEDVAHHTNHETLDESPLSRFGEGPGEGSVRPTPTLHLLARAYRAADTMRGGSSGLTGSESATMAETKRQPEGRPRTDDGARDEHAIPRTHAGRRLPPRVSYRHLFVQIVAFVVGVLALVGIGVSIYAYQQVDRTEQDTQRQIRQVSDTLRQTSSTLGTVTAAAQQGASTVDESTQALTDAAKTVRATADRLDDTAGKINFTIPLTNQKPLAGVDENFRAEAVQLRQFAVEVDRTRDSFAKNAGNLRTIADQVNIVAKQVNDIGTITDHFAAPGSGDIAAMARNFRLVLLWSVVVHIMLLLMCVALIVLTVDHWTLAHLFRRRAEPAHAWFDPERGVEGDED